ncbi:flagellin [Arthrobacter sp. 49Tsu3.1M3]|jgi:flagellin|uniref:flagellin N-terminal helical domain-containing protein n=1 Tax=Arthrobacter sp. 49Tsu3.1M3 TaxID=1279029 RepID=UPI0009A5B763|nr:flagellin [Arthrobacter sp. 49Tsu3.1M3]SKC07117.1 flagellin [Arthrobacter sp. 49Tsu3.1M3]
MGMQINTNMAANNAYRSLSNTQTDLSKSLEKLSSGLRINRAGDDAAGLAISEGLKSQIGGLTVASRNAQDGIGLVQTAEGGLNQAHSILQRLRDLGVQAANDTNNNESRAAIKTEATSLVNELGRISGGTDFNGTKLLNGDNTKLSIQVGANGDADSQIAVDLSGANVKAIATTLNLGALASGGSTFDIADATALAGAATFTSTKDGVVTTVTTADLGSSFTSVEGYADALRGDADFSAKFTVSVEKDANGAGTGIVVQAKDGGTLLDADNGTAGTGLAAGAETASVGTGLDFTSATKAQASIKLIDQQIIAVSTARADLGATQNRLESAVQTINVAKENLTASNSRIRDTDMAEEMVKFTRNNILSQAGTAMLAQANQSNQGVLQLLR